MRAAKKEGSLRRPKFTFSRFISARKARKNKPTGNSAHARCQKGGVPEEAEIYLQSIHVAKNKETGRTRVVFLCLLSYFSIFIKLIQKTKL